MAQIFSKGLFLFCFFIAWFGVKLTMLPVNGIMIVGAAGFLWVLYKSIHYKKSFLPKRIKPIVGTIILLIFMVVITTICNQHFDIYFVREIIIINIFRLFAAFILIHYFNRLYIRNRLETFTIIISMMTVIQIMLAFMIFFNPMIYNLFSKIFIFESMATDGALEVRPFGLGGYSFFGAGIINSINLILIAFVLNYRCSGNKTFLVVSYIIISLFGIIMARTTIIGFVLSFVILIQNRNGRKSFIKMVLSVAIVLILFVGFRFSSKISDSIDRLFEFGFEVFINYAENGSIETSSTNSLKQMYILPDSQLTWLIGDGYYRSNEVSYYKGTDVGYLRLLFYFGAGGTVLFLLYQTLILYYSRRLFYPKTYLMLLIFSSLLFILNLKGITDLSFFYFLLFFLANDKKSPTCKRCYSGLQC